MILAARRVVQGGGEPSPRTGINAFCYLHGDRMWLDAPPDDLGPGQLVNQIIEVAPSSGNRVRSFLDITAPDATPSRQIVAAIQASAEFLSDAGEALPWYLAHGEVAFRFDAEAALAAHWQVELRLLLGYALSVRRAGPEGVVSADILET